jgi:transcriptional regulator with XRE-family HTH domain
VNLAKRIKEARAKAQISRETLARRANMSLTGLAQLEQGSRTDPHISTLRKIAEALDVPVADLLEDAESPLVLALPWRSGAAPKYKRFQERTV